MTDDEDIQTRLPDLSAIPLADLLDTANPWLAAAAERVAAQMAKDAPPASRFQSAI